MQAAIDVGSNTIRMLLGDCHQGKLIPHSYHREMTRLAGDFSILSGLSAPGMDRALSALKTYKNILSEQAISGIRVVGTEALRRAENRQVFIAQVFHETGFEIEVIAGAEEAVLTSRGVLSVIDPIPEAAIVIDIGGGSTELVCLIDGEIRFQKSYPLGVVRLCEECFSDVDRQQQIDTAFHHFVVSLNTLGLADKHYQLIGTAGTITTLAAIHLQLKNYDSLLVNNHLISIDWLSELQLILKTMSVTDREVLIGMEPGRGDLILPGIQILLTLIQKLQLENIIVADSGLLEGVMLGMK